MLKDVQRLKLRCLLDSSAPRGPPDVPPRNPAMSRLNGRLPGSHAASDHERDPDLEPSCLVRTPSGNFYNIPKIPKNEYNNKNQSTGNSPIKVELQNNMDRVPLPYGHAPSMIPMRRQSIRCHFRKGIDWCSWKLIAIVVIMLSLCLTAALTYVAASHLVNWSYQGTKACSVLVGENTDAKPSSGEANKTSTSSTSTSSQSSGRTRPQSSSGGSISTSDSMLLDGVVYSRKRRDTFNEHALHQTVAPSPSRHDPEDLSLTTVAEAETSGFGWQRSVPLHEKESSGKVVHDPEHVDGQSPVRGAIDRSIEAIKDTPPESSGSTAPSRMIQLVVNVSSTATNYSHDHSIHTTVGVDHLASSSSVSVGSGNSLASASVRQSSYNETSSTTLRSSQDTSAKYTPKFAAADGNVHVASKAPVTKLSRDDFTDFGRDIDNVGTSESSDFVESNGGIEATTSASGSESTKLGADSRERLTDKRDEELSSKDSVRPYATSTTEDYYPSSTDTAESGESTNETSASTYESEVSTDAWSCSGSTPLPPEPTILILEGARTFPARSFPPDGTTFAQVGLSQKLSKEIPPYGYWNMQFYQSEAAYVRFDYNIPRGASIGVYARRNALPTHTQYDLLEVLSGFKARTTRASHPSIKKEVTKYMEPGHWFLSLYNDDGDPHEVSFIAVIAEDMTHNCPNGCSGKGECLLGHCQCKPGFGGEDCSESVCPVLCSQRGEYINGECQCNPGWKGKECSLRHDECEVPDCNGHGHCTNGKCNCVRGYKGKYCEEVDCPHPTCSGHGFCAEGTCICKKGWKGADCSQMDKEALQCLPDCSGHGNFDLETQTCVCEPMWSGDDCSKELCDLDCGPHGHCVDNACDCLPGWSGELCNLKQCDPRCNEHGQCKNGTCLCVTGWNGKHCTMEGCPNSCSGHGQCRVSNDAQWECQCYNGWDGKDCNVLLEQNCNDGRDNDKDGLIDCADPECCSNHICHSSQLCVSAPKPIDILLRKQPPAITASFFERMKFLIDEGSLQNYARQETFNESATRVSYRYHIALSPLDGVLYISDPESHQIIRVRDTNDYTDPDHNWETVVGSGERCLPGDEAHCGDGALARDAKLAYPKGVAVSADNVLYFADGTNIRMVDRDGIITTVIGNHMHKSHWKPIPCEGTLNVEEVHLRWPTELAINPLDNSLHMIDDHMVLQLAPDGRVKVVAGRPLHCASPSASFDTELATHATLVMPQSVAFGPSGDLYIAESDSQRINRVRVIGTDGKISPYAGAESKCNCLERGCDCFEADHYLASTSKFNTISAVAVSPDGVVHIGDQANYRIRSVTASIPDASGAREYEIYAPDTQEIYVFNRFGQHISTRNILTGEIVYQFTYNVNTSNGKLSTVTDAAGNKVFLLRDYSSQVNSIENTKGQKCRLKMSRMKMLHELSTPDDYNVTFDYHGPTGLLKTKLDSTGRSYVYNYDEFGRLTSAVTPTGKVISLTFDLSLKGAVVKVGQNNRKPISMLIKGSSVVTKIGEAEQRTTVLADGSVGRVTPWAHTVSTDSMPYSILAELEPLLGESYPVPAKQRTEISGDLANRFEWRYFLRKIQGNKNRGNSKAIAQVGRKLRVNGEILLSLEYDRETNTVAVFMDDRVELLNVTYDRTARPVKWGPRNGIFAGVELEYDRFSRLTSWTWGDISETYGFDRSGRLYEIKYSDGTSMVYAFKDMFSILPLKVTTPRGSDYLLQYDEAGALQSLTTPRGHIHTFSLQTSLGFYKYQYYSPMNRHPYEILYNDDGQILAKVYPHQSGKVAYVYDHAGKLETTLAGLSSIHYTYQETTSLVRSIDINEPNFEMRIEYKYHAGIVKDEKIKFGSKSGMDNAHYRYQYDGNARISGIEVDINGKQLPQLRLKYNQNLGVLEGVGDLRIYRNLFNRSVMQDSSKQFFTVTDYDEHGRVKTVLMNIRSFDVFRMELEYDNRNRIKMRKLTIGKDSMEKKEWSRMEKITYNADGHVLEVADTENNWQYAYDENGNVIGVTEHNEKIVLGYDSGDRVVQYGDVEFNSYDGRGFVVIRGEHKYRYNSRGQLIHASEHKKFQIWYFYDDRGRLVSMNDDRENITQFFYANPKTPDLITHVHFPKSSKTFRFLYDSRDFLMTVETSEQRFYVATDQNGSPLALFDTNGNLIKEMRRTPFGKIIKDTNPDFYLPIDFHGGLFDPNTKLIYLNKRLYDPTVGQWMTPAWEQMANELTTPTDIFIYRFRNNDPINFKQNVEYMTDLGSWLKLYGYDISMMLGSEYTKHMVYQPSATVTSPQLTPDFGVMSGLQCIVNRVQEKFSDLGFVPKPLLKLEPKTRNLLPRVAHRRAVFGEGILVSRVGGRALVSVVDGVNSVVQDVVTSVFNNSYFLPLHFSVHDQDVFYFVKDNALKIRDDMEELHRLGSMFNVSTHETTEHGAGTWKELRLHNPDAAVVIKYGADPEQERHRILKHAHKRAVERAWEIEKQLVMAGFQGRGDWSKEEKDELMSRGTVDGYEGVDIHSVHRYPQLADDPGNVAFTRDTKRKRRKSGNRRNRTHRHDS
ncbi:Teneurin-3 [Trachymyrmex septentrionalis]|uniref:Tenascin-like protein n=1 Tax=Trachymyrmex septentrionalis TaxID=34720 RepID=A0A195FG46_9HYME|nr:Teneurin-3 [Trachymyrmex septentrionalis]